MRKAILSLFCFVALASCDPAALEKPELRSYEIIFAGTDFQRVEIALREFADHNRFSIVVVGRNTNTGVERQFELRRRDLWIEAINPPKDIPAVVPPSRDGRPGVEIETDTNRFIVGFYRGDVEPTDEALADASAQFVAAVQVLPGVTISQRQ